MQGNETDLLLEALQQQLKWLQRRGMGTVNLTSLPEVQAAQLWEGLSILQPSPKTQAPVQSRLPQIQTTETRSLSPSFDRQSSRGDAPQSGAQPSFAAEAHRPPLSQERHSTAWPNSMAGGPDTTSKLRQTPVSKPSDHGSSPQPPHWLSDRFNPSAQPNVPTGMTEAVNPEEGKVLDEDGQWRKPLHLITSLKSLHLNYIKCQRCGLCQNRTNFVFDTGNQRSPLMFIGEGPGEEEDKQGVPFVGRAGQLLTKIIEVLGVARKDVYIANVVKCRPPDNRNPEPNEIAKCLPILSRQIELLNPRLIVTLGNIPTKALNPNAPGITKARGKLFHYQNWPVLPTYHPAFLLRNINAMEEVWQDCQQIRKLCFEGGL